MCSSDLIIGGLTRACLSIHARVIGAPNRIRTEIEIGNDPGLAHAVHEKAAERDGKENKLLEIGKLLTVADRNPGKFAPDIVARAEEAAAAMSAEIEILRGEEEDLRYRLELTQKARLDAENAVFEGCVVSMGEQSLRIPQDRGATTVRLAGTGLGVFALEDNPNAEQPQRPTGLDAQHRGR